MIDELLKAYPLVDPSKIVNNGNLVKSVVDEAHSEHRLLELLLLLSETISWALVHIIQRDGEDIWEKIMHIPEV